MQVNSEDIFDLRCREPCHQAVFKPTMTTLGKETLIFYPLLTRPY